jgi:hypothetical protein
MIDAPKLVGTKEEMPGIGEGVGMGLPSKSVKPRLAHVDGSIGLYVALVVEIPSPRDLDNGEDMLRFAIGWSVNRGLGFKGELHWYDRVRLWPLVMGVWCMVLANGAV